MLSTIIQAFLWSISPLGEARVGIFYAIGLGVDPFTTFFVCLLGNLLVYPLLRLLILNFNDKLWSWRPYKRQAVKLSQRSKRLVGKHIEKYGFWGLMVFVMIPLPVTGAYMGTIAAFIFNLNPRQALYSVSIGVTISCIIVTLVAYFGFSIFS